MLGLTVEGVRSRIRRGTLETVKDVDGTVYVLLDELVKPSTEQSSDGPTNLTLIIGRLENEVEFLREELRLEREANRENRRIIMTMAQSLRELAPASDVPSDARESPQTASEASSRGEAPEEREEPKKRPWWQRIFQ